MIVAKSLGTLDMTKKTLAGIPYGIASFDEFRAENLAYADKTQAIEVLESRGKFPLLVRPRRFGKTLLVSMLQAYYDKAAQDAFDVNFSDTYIAEHPTPLKGKFHVLRLDFSGIDTDDVAYRFARKVQSGMLDFFCRYPMEGSKALLDKAYASPSELLLDFQQLVQPKIGKTLYLIIDEYDHFAYDILSKDKEQFKQITSREGFLRNFYANIKGMTSNFIARTFITGVTTISLDSLSSGFNIAKNYSTEPEFAVTYGFTESELRDLIAETVDLKAYGQTLDQVFVRMKDYYNGYRFSPRSDTAVFNAAMCWYYLDHIRHNKDEPDNMLDPSVASDLDKIHGILSCGDEADRRRIVEDALAGRPIAFPVLADSLNLNQRNSFNEPELLSTLFYLGYLTYAPGQTKQLVCPNKAIREQFFGYYFKKLNHLRDVTFTGGEIKEEAMALNKGNMEPFVRAASERLTRNVGLHALTHLSETALQFYLLAAAGATSDFKVTAEEEARGKGYADLVFRPTEASGVDFMYLLELKYLPKSKEPRATDLEKLMTEAEEQLNRYAAAPDFLTEKTVKKVAVIFVGTEIAAFKQF